MTWVLRTWILYQSEGTSNGGSSISRPSSLPKIPAVNINHRINEVRKKTREAYRGHFTETAHKKLRSHSTRKKIVRPRGEIHQHIPMRVDWRRYVLAYIYMNMLYRDVAMIFLVVFESQYTLVPIRDDDHDDHPKKLIRYKPINQKLK